jgi:hypothetical protein
MMRFGTIGDWNFASLVHAAVVLIAGVRDDRIRCFHEKFRCSACIARFAQAPAFIGSSGGRSGLDPSQTIEIRCFFRCYQRNWASPGADSVLR